MTASAQCLPAQATGNEAFVHDANKQRSVPGSEWSKEPGAQAASRAAKKYLATLDDVAFGAASRVTPKFVSHRSRKPSTTFATKSALSVSGQTAGYLSLARDMDLRTIDPSQDLAAKIPPCE
ncbi:MAG TPA: hypothetical protein VLJ17_13185 [Xanthobacteraceae bacterium]|jgi:hypothetical protein|nr:hypothetical protein [Xanthobacteraceae bacterium]